MKTLSRDQILLLHSQLIERYGGTHGVRDEGLLNSALNSRSQAVLSVIPFSIPVILKSHAYFSVHRLKKVADL